MHPGRNAFRRGAAAIVVGGCIGMAGCVASSVDDERPAESGAGGQPSLAVQQYGVSISPEQRSVQLRLQVLNASPDQAVTLDSVELRGPLSEVSGEAGFVRSSADDEFVATAVPDGPYDLATQVDVGPTETVGLVVTAEVDCSASASAEVLFAAGDGDDRSGVSITEFAAIEDDWLDEVTASTCDDVESD